MKKLIVMFFILSFFSFSGPLWSEEEGSPYSAKVANKVGDILMINIDEYHQASQKADTRLKRNSAVNSKVDLSWSQAASYLDSSRNSRNTGAFALNADKNFSGSGSTGRSSSLEAQLTAVIYKVEEDRYYIRGSKTIIVNNEDEEITIEGIIRKEDIGRNNTINSSKISNAILKLKGYGDVSRDQEKGLFGKMFDWLF